MGEDWKQSWNFLSWIVMRLVRMESFQNTEEIVMKRKDLQKSQMAAETGAGSVPDFVVYRTHFGKMRTALYRIKKEEEEPLELALKKWMWAIENGTCST